MSTSDSKTLRSLIASRLKDLRREHYDSLTHMARAAGVSQSKMSRITREEQKGVDAYLEVASKVAEDLGIDVKEITDPTPPASSENGGEVMRLYHDVEVGAGNGIEPVDQWTFTKVQVPRSILASMLGGRGIPEDIGITPVRGQSMYPEIQSGDYVVWTPETRVIDGGTYLIRLDEGLLLKVLQRKAGQRLRIHSLNAEFTDDYIRKTDSGMWVTDDDNEYVVDFEVIGEYLGVIQEKELFRGTQRVRDALTAYQTLEKDHSAS